MTAISEFEVDQFGKPLISLSPEQLYAFGDRIRRTEQLILSLFSKGLVSGTTHTCIGQEFCQMGVVRAMNNPRDVVLSNHRNHGHYLTYSANFVGLVAEVMGRQAGVCGGVGGSQHIADRHFHSNGVQAGMTGSGVGYALARKREGDGGIVACVIGDGTLGEGLLYESMNLSAVWELPILFVVEANQVAQTTPTAETTGGSILARGEAFGLRTWTLNDSAPDFFEQAESVVDETRRLQVPGFLVIETRRMGPHSKGDDFRDPDELDAIRRRDPLRQMGERLEDDVRAAIEQANQEFMEEVDKTVTASPLSQYPAPPTHVFLGSSQATNESPLANERIGNVRASLNASLRNLLEQSDKTFVIGEDLHDPYGGAFKVTKGLSSDFPDRVLSTPISEAAIVGAGVGLAMAGYQPIIEVMFADFLTLAADQIYNHAVKFGALFPENPVPIVIRTPSGGRRGYGPTHSQSPENIFVSMPGLTVVFPSHRHNAGGLLENAVRWKHPVVYFEHKLLYGVDQSPGDYEVVAAHPDDSAASLFPTLRSGATEPDVTLIAYGGILSLVEEAAEQLRDDEELEVEVLTPSLLAPLPKHTLLQCLAGRERVVVIEESQTEFGVGAEILAALAESGFRGRAVRLGCPPFPIPSARSLEVDVIPSKAQIVQRVLEQF